MSFYLARVEMHGASEVDYDKLHLEMEKEGFKRYFTTDDKTEHWLPHATYWHGDVGETCLAMRSRVEKAVRRVGKTASILVLPFSEWCYSGLEET